MNAFAHRAPITLGLVYFALLLGGCNGGSASSAIPPSSTRVAAPLTNGGGGEIWAAAEQTSKLFGLSSNGKHVLKVISTENQPVKGGDPLTLKVDGKDLFVTDLTGGKAGVIQEYKAGHFVEAYSPDCAVSNCSDFSGSVTDVVVDRSHVFAIMKQIQYKVGTYYVNRSGYEYWPRGNPSATPVAVLLTSDCSAICFYDAGAEDSSGNLWLRDNGGGYSYGVVEVTNPTTDPSMSQGLSLESFTIDAGDIAGFSISNGGTVLNAGDSSHKIYQYALPLTYNSSPFNTLTPCAQGCDPHGFGFNRNDKLIVVGDGAMSPSSGSLDIGQVSKNQWKKVTNKQFTAPFSSAVYVPSGK